MTDTIANFRKTNNADIFNYIREGATESYRQRIPEATQSHISEALDNLLHAGVDNDGKPFINQFYNALINRIGRTYVNESLWNNPLAEFKRAAMMYGSTMEEIQLGLVKAQAYNSNEETSEKDLWATEQVPLEALYHTINSRNKYKISVRQQDLRTAFRTDTGLAQLISAQMASLIKSDQIDEYNQMTRMFVEYAKRGGYYRVHTDDVTGDDVSETSARKLLRQLRKYAAEMCVKPRSDFNAAHMPVAARPQDLVIFGSPAVKAAIDVEGLAPIFNLDKAQMPSRFITVNEGDFGIQGNQAILTTRNFFVAYDNLPPAEFSLFDPNLMQYNYWLHHWATYSVSLFAPAILLWTGEGTKTTLVEPENVKAAKPTLVASVTADGSPTALDHVERGGIARLHADVEISNADAATYKPTAVTYKLEAERQLSQYTYISENGDLVVGMDEPNSKLIVTAQATYIDPAHPEVPSEISNALTLPVKGKGVVGFMPALVTALTAKAPNVKVNGEGRITVLAKMVDGQQADVSNIAEYTVKSGTSVTVDRYGRLTGKAAGKSTVHVTMFTSETDVDVTVA